MSKRKKQHKREKPERAGEQVAPGAPSLWPADFVPLRKAALAAFCVAGWGFILAMYGAGFDPLGVLVSNLNGAQYEPQLTKQVISVIAGARIYPLLLMESRHNLDIAAVLFTFVLVLGAGYIHVSLGLAVLLAIAPWRDGYTYEVDNYYFLWAAMLLLGIWSLRQWSKPQPIRGVLPLGLLILFWAVSALAGLNTIQFDSTYRELLFWVYYGVVLFLALNSTNGRGARAAVLCGLFAGMAGQAIYAYPYLYDLMPFLRENMGAGSALLADNFGGISEATPDIARRLNMNRAAASMVHANALAALMILGLPACLALAADGWSRIQDPQRPPADQITAFRYLLPWALAVFAIVAAIVFFLGMMKLTYNIPNGRAWFGGATGLSVLTAAVAGSAMGAFLFAARARGLAVGLLYLRTAAMTLLFPAMLGALWLTYSRGAMLSLALAIIAVAAVILLPPDIGERWVRRVRPRGRRAVAGTGMAILARSHVRVLAGVCLFTIAAVSLWSAGLPSSAYAQDDPVSTANTATSDPPANAMTGEGIDVGISELANPATLWLRLSYWRVALSMATDNWLTGVGPGNFKFAYPRYQYLGAGDVQNAHNGILQTWCETGIFGVLALITFWCVLLWAGARAVRGATRIRESGLAAGLLAGILAYLLHALLDMNLQHPTLVAFAMVVTGLLWRTIEARNPGGGGGRPYGRIVTVAALAVATLASGMALRPYMQHLGLNGGKYLNVGDTTMVERRYRTAEYFLSKGPEWALGGKRTAPPELDVRSVVTLVSERAQLFELGHLAVRDPRTAEVHRVPEDAPIPPAARFQIVRPWDAQSIVYDTVLAWLGEVERLDARLPHSPDHALTLCSGYKLLAEHAGKHHAEQRAVMLERVLHWGREAVRRSPLRADVYQMLGWSHWTNGTYTKGQESLDHFKAALNAFEMSTQLAPNEASYHLMLSQTTRALGQSYQNAGQAEEAARYLEQAKAEAAEAERIWRRRGALGLP